MACSSSTPKLHQTWSNCSWHTNGHRNAEDKSVLKSQNDSKCGVPIRSALKIGLDGLDMPWPSIAWSPGTFSKSCASRARRFSSSAWEEWQGPRLPPGKPPAAMASWGRFRVPGLLYGYKQKWYGCMRIYVLSWIVKTSQGGSYQKNVIPGPFHISSESWRRCMKVYQGVSRCHREWGFAAAWARTGHASTLQKVRPQQPGFQGFTGARNANWFPLVNPGNRGSLLSSIYVSCQVETNTCGWSTTCSWISW